MIECVTHWLAKFPDIRLHDFIWSFSEFSADILRARYSKLEMAKEGMKTVKDRDGLLNDVTH